MIHWKDVVGHTGYMVSNDGRIANSKTARVLRPRPDEKGYLRVTLYHPRKLVTVHSVVAKAFLGSRPPDHEVNHKDGNKANCADYNLEYVTCQENALHARRIGLITRENMTTGETSPWAKLTEETAAAARSEYVRGKHGHGIHALAKKYGVCPTTMKQVLTGKTWAYVGKL